MPQYQLFVAIALIVAAACSFAINILSRQEGQIKLPVYNDANEDDEGLLPSVDSKDPFDVTKAEDFLDGYPLHEEGFWKKVLLLKLLIVVLCTTIALLQTVSLGWTIADEGSDDIATYALQTIFAFYILVLSARWITQKSILPHSYTGIHITALSCTASVLLCATAIIPSKPFDVQRAIGGSSTLGAMWYTNMALYLAVLVIAANIPGGPRLHFPPSSIYSEKTLASTTYFPQANVCGITVASPVDYIMFSYTTKVVMLGNNSASLEIGDLPIVPASMRATVLFATMKTVMRTIKLRIRRWRPKPGSGWELMYKLTVVNKLALTTEIILAAVSACFFYAPAFFLRQLVVYLENDEDRVDKAWGLVWAAGLFFMNAFTYLMTAQLWSLATTTIQVRLKIQMNSILFAKTLVRKDVASSSGAQKTSDGDAKPSSPVSADETPGRNKDDDEADFSSKAQIMTLMTTDVDRVSEFAWHLFALVDSPIEVIIGTVFLYKLLGVSCFIGLAVTCLFLPLNHFAGQVIVGAQENLMKARDERVALMNEILGGIRMIKFMAWERSFEKRVLKVRDRELKYQKRNYLIETLFNAIWNGSPVLVTLVSFWHFTVIRGQVLKPSTAFTAISVFNEMKFALNALPETFINMLQGLVSVRRIEKYLAGVEVKKVPPLESQSQTIALQSATLTWPQDRTITSAPSSAVSTPRYKFILQDLSINFPRGELSLICGKLGSGKTLLLLSLLGEADVLAGQVLCPRSPPDAIANFAEEVNVKAEDWVVQGLCAYVPQVAWLRNASIKENILFNLPFDSERYQRTLEVCALVSDLNILEDGDESEIGERGVNLSGGQKARVSLARAVYSRASVLLLDDVLSAVDAHTAHHLYEQCLKGDLMSGRTVILVSHHVQLCVPGAAYVVALDNGRLLFAGERDKFQNSGVMTSLVQSSDVSGGKEDEAAEDLVEEQVAAAIDDEKKDGSVSGDISDASSTAAATTATSDTKIERKAPRKLVEEEKRAVGRIGPDIWKLYIWACGPVQYWAIFLFVLMIAALSPVAENGWLKIWSGSQQTGDGSKSAAYYIGCYAAITAAGLVITTCRWFILYDGSIRASQVLYKRLLETVLFANIRFHDTVSRGRLLNRFGKDFEGIDSSLADNFGRSIMYLLSTTTTFVTIAVVGGWPFVIAALIIGVLYWNVATVFGQTSRDMRRLDSVTRSPLYSIYGETIAGVTILRAFGASSKFLRDMLMCVDTNSNPYYWMWGVNRWLSTRFNLLSSAVIGVTGLVAVLTPSISASLAGFALAFASTVTGDLLFLVRRFVGLEQSMVALERVKEYSELAREAPEFIEPRPPAPWPSKGAIQIENLVIRYAPDLPNVLHHLSFEIKPGEKVGILGRTGSGKSTLALSFFRFVEATEGHILVDGVDIAKVGLTDLRTKLTIIPQDPTILSGTVRNTLDVFDEYDDSQIFEALRRVHLIPSSDTEAVDPQGINVNVFRDLDSSVSEGGDNFSTGEKQLLCMARAILKRSRVLVMDEATASVDYATDELISKTIRQEFAQSTILTIAHRLRTIIDYDRVMLLDNGRILEYDKPSVLLANASSSFYALCKATGKEEFAMLKRLVR